MGGGGGAVLLCGVFRSSPLGATSDFDDFDDVEEVREVTFEHGLVVEDVCGIPGWIAFGEGMLHPYSVLCIKHVQMLRVGEGGEGQDLVQSIEGVGRHGDRIELRPVVEVQERSALRQAVGDPRDGLDFVLVGFQCRRGSYLDCGHQSHTVDSMLVSAIDACPRTRRAAVEGFPRVEPDENFGGTIG